MPDGIGRLKRDSAISMTSLSVGENLHFSDLGLVGIQCPLLDQ